MQDNSGSPYVNRISADLTTTSTSAVDATGLSFPIGANEVWKFEFFGNIGSSSAAGAKYAITVPSGATVQAVANGTTSAATAFTNEELTSTLSTTAYNTAGLTTAAVGAYLWVRGVCVNGSTPGTVQLQHAKVTSGTATIYTNAFVEAQRVA